MNDNEDASQKVGLWVVFTVVTAVVIGVLWFAGATVLRRGAAPAATVVAAPVVVEGETLVEIVPTGDAVAVVYFELAQAVLPMEAADAIEKTLKAAADKPNARVLLSGYHDATGDAAKNAELAKNRAKAVREALAANGLGTDRVLLRKPLVTTGDGSDREARRVEIHLVEAP